MNSSPQPAQQATGPDLSGITMAHRAMLDDSRRIADLMAAVAQGRHSCTHPKEVARYIALLCESIHHHHTVEDEVAWPVVRAAVGSHVDLSELVDDHAALDPRLERITALAASFARTPTPMAAAPLAAALTDLHGLLRDHIADEEREVFDVIRQNVSVQDWETVEKAAQRAGRMSFDGPRIVSAATPEEYREMAAGANPLLLVFIKLMMRRHKRFERRVFG